MKPEFLRLLPPELHGLVPDFLMMATLAIIAGCFGTLRLWKRQGGDQALARDLLFWSIPGLFLGAKFLFFLQYGFPANLAGWFSLGGFALYGGLFGVVLTLVLLRLFRTYPVLAFLDVVAPATGAGLFLGRIGCFLAGCNWGKPTKLPWGIAFPAGSHAFEQQVADALIPTAAEYTLPVHPTQLYEAVFALLGAGLLLRLLRRRLPVGTVFFSGLAAYGVYRFATELLRADQGGQWFGPLSFAQVVSVLLVPICLVTLAVLYRGQTEARGMRLEVSG